MLQKFMDCQNPDTSPVLHQRKSTMLPQNLPDDEKNRIAQVPFATVFLSRFICLFNHMIAC